MWLTFQISVFVGLMALDAHRQIVSVHSPTLCWFMYVQVYCKVHCVLAATYIDEPLHRVVGHLNFCLCLSLLLLLTGQSCWCILLLQVKGQLRPNCGPRHHPLLHQILCQADSAPYCATFCTVVLWSDLNWCSGTALPYRNWFRTDARSSSGELKSQLTQLVKVQSTGNGR